MSRTITVTRAEKPGEAIQVRVLSLDRPEGAYEQLQQRCLELMLLMVDFHERFPEAQLNGLERAGNYHGKRYICRLEAVPTPYSCDTCGVPYPVEMLECPYCKQANDAVAAEWPGQAFPRS